MTKREFIDELRKKLSGLPAADVEERLSFYGEMIDDKIEDSCTEDEAVLSIGSIDEISEQIIADIPFSKIASERIKIKKRLGAWEIILLVLGAPIWLALVISAFSVVLSLYASVWSVIVSLWAVFVSFVACAVSGVLGGISLLFTEKAVVGIVLIGLGFVLSGISILFYYGCKIATRGIILLTKKLALSVKKCFVRKDKYNG